MDYFQLTSISRNTEFKDLCQISIVRAATSVKSESPVANPTIALKRNALADKVLSGSALQAVFYQAVAYEINLTNASLLTPFLTTPVVNVDAGFQAVLNTKTDSLFNAFAGVSLSD